MTDTLIEWLRNITFLQVIDFVGTFAFAISGIRLASAKRFDWFGAYVVGAAILPWQWPVSPAPTMQVIPSWRIFMTMRLSVSRWVTHLRLP